MPAVLPPPCRHVYGAGTARFLAVWSARALAANKIRWPDTVWAVWDSLLFTDMWWTGEQCKKVKVSHTRLPSVVLRS